MSALRAVILDYGEVLSLPAAPGMMERLADALGMDPETFPLPYFAERGLYDRGDLTPEAYWSRAAGGRRLDETLLERLRRWDVEMWCGVDHRMVAWTGQLRAAGFRTGLLSNMNFELTAHLRRNFAWLAEMDSLIFSCEVHRVKPEPEIYALCLEALQVTGPEALFIDDREENLRAARAVGTTGLRFTSVAGLRRDLEALGFPVLPAVE